MTDRDRGCDEGLLEIVGTRRELYSNDCLQNLALARELQARAGERFADAVTIQGLARLRGKGQQLAQQMATMDFGRSCTACAAKPNGGCCSRFMADENDGVQLLMNLLDGVSIDVSNDNGIDCCFLGACGCQLAFKPFFCLNYDCAALKTGSGEEALARYDQLRGLLLQEQWRLEQHLLMRLAAMGVVRQ